MTSIPTFFRKLPREIRDEIYVLAHTDGREHLQPLEIVSSWYWDENIHCKTCYRCSKGVNPCGAFMKKKPPACPLYRMLVSKQWYDECSTIWVQRTTFLPTNVTDLNRILEKSPTLRQNIRRLEFFLDEGHDDFETLARHLQNLRSLTVRISHNALCAPFEEKWDFNGILRLTNEFVPREEFEKEFAGSTAQAFAREMAHVKRVEFVPWWLVGVPTNPLQKYVDANVRAFADVIRQEMVERLEERARQELKDEKRMMKSEGVEAMSRKLMERNMVLILGGIVLMGIIGWASVLV